MMWGSIKSALINSNTNNNIDRRMSKCYLEDCRHYKAITAIHINVCKILFLHRTQYTHHNLKHMLPQHCKTYKDVFLLINSTKV